MSTPTLQIVGAGLLGTSMGLALARSPWRVWIADADPSPQSLAESLGAGTAGWAASEPDLVILAVPPRALGEVMAHVAQRFPSATISDVASIKSEPIALASGLGIEDRFIGGHPMAGRERSGAAAAQADLFDARPWALCAPSEVDPGRVELVESLVRACGADPVHIDPATHDAAVALVSHLPHVAACAVAGQLTEADPAAMTLAGQGLRDTVRVSAGDPHLWVEILGGNASALAPLVQQLAVDLQSLAQALADSDSSGSVVDVDKQIKTFLDKGQRGFQKIPGKHGAPPADYAVIPVVIPDEPGALARLFTTVASAGASVEDIALEHAPGHPVGIIELSVQRHQANALVAALQHDGWAHH
jgi:prephenate dehydrogenase